MTTQLPYRAGGGRREMPFVTASIFVNLRVSDNTKKSGTLTAICLAEYSNGCAESVGYPCT
jgi:hypothetical protein